jgi:hypothetical protein
MRLSPNYASYSFLPGLSFILSRMSLKNKIALLFIFSGLISAVGLSLILSVEKLILVIPAPTALIGAGLGQWSSSSESNKNDK